MFHPQWHLPEVHLADQPCDLRLHPQASEVNHVGFRMRAVNPMSEARESLMFLRVLQAQRGWCRYHAAGDCVLLSSIECTQVAYDFHNEY